MTEPPDSLVTDFFELLHLAAVSLLSQTAQPLRQLQETQLHTSVTDAQQDTSG